MSPNRSLDLDVLARCVEAIDLNCDKLADYHSWLVLLRAICAACGGDMPFFADIVLPWLRTNATNVEDDGDARMEMKWRTFATARSAQSSSTNGPRRSAATMASR